MFFGNHNMYDEKRLMIMTQSVKNFVKYYYFSPISTQHLLPISTSEEYWF